MHCKLDKDYKCAPDGYIIKEFKAGEIITGQAAEYAIADKAGKEVKPPKAKIDDISQSKKKDKPARQLKPTTTKPKNGPTSKG